MGPGLDALTDGGPAEDLLDLDDAQEQYTGHDLRKAKLVELLFFAGLTLEPVAASLGISLPPAQPATEFDRGNQLQARLGQGHVSHQPDPSPTNQNAA